MKKFLCFAIVCFVLALACAAAEPATELPVGYGSIEDVGGWIGAYCNEWNRSVGSNFKVDMSFDESKYTLLNSEVTEEGIAFTAEIDGVIFDILMHDDGMEVMSMRVDISNDKVERLYIGSRICAMIAVLCYDTPSDWLDMAELYSTIYTQYAGLFTEYVGSRQDDYSVTVKGTKATHEFYFHYDGTTDYFSTDSLAS